MSLEIKAIIGVIILAAILGLGLAIHRHGYNQAKLEDKNAALEAKAKAEARYNDIAAKYEGAKNAKQIVYQTITKQVDKIIDRPVYRNVCLDDDGLRSINDALQGKRTSEPVAAMPAAVAP